MKLSNSMMERLRVMAEDEPIDHDDLFGETPDDAYQKGVADGMAELAREVLEDTTRDK